MKITTLFCVGKKMENSNIPDFEQHGPTVPLTSDLSFMRTSNNKHQGLPLTDTYTKTWLHTSGKIITTIGDFLTSAVKITKSIFEKGVYLHYAPFLCLVKVHGFLL
jgi:hypothetical protein